MASYIWRKGWAHNAFAVHNVVVARRARCWPRDAPSTAILTSAHSSSHARTTTATWVNPGSRGSSGEPAVAVLAAHDSGLSQTTSAAHRAHGPRAGLTIRLNESWPASGITDRGRSSVVPPALRETAPLVHGSPPPALHLRGRSRRPRLPACDGPSVLSGLHGVGDQRK
jgi:hypothetical protein